MKHIKLGQRGARCSWCNQIAPKRGYGMSAKRSCPDHTNLLRLDEEEQNDDGHQSEGERQAMSMFGI